MTALLSGRPSDAPTAPFPSHISALVSVDEHQRGRRQHAELGRVQRGRIVAAAIGVVAACGAADTTVSAIVTRAGVSRRTFYEIFDSVDDCLLAAVDESVARMRRCLDESYVPSQPWSKRIRSGIEALLRFFDGEPYLARLLVVETLAAGPRVLAARTRALDPLIAAVDAGRWEGRPNASVTSLTAEAAVGAVLAVLHARICEESSSPLIDLAGPLASTIVLPYLGASRARRELERVVAEPPVRRPGANGSGAPALERLPMRLTFRTVCVLRAMADHPGANNRQIGHAAGVADQGQISKLLARLQRLGLATNERDSQRGGQANAWRLSERGMQVVRSTDDRPGSGAEGEWRHGRP